MFSGPILGFFGEYRFLSNFEPAEVVYDGIKFPSVENAYQAAKCDSRAQQLRFVNISAGAAKRLGRSVQMRPDWEQIKVGIMYELLKQKFSQEPFLQLLLDTGDAYLEETNTWGDQFWGVCRGKGQNMLGRLLMSIRDNALKSCYGICA